MKQCHNIQIAKFGTKITIKLTKKRNLGIEQDKLHTFWITICRATVILVIASF